MLKKVVHKFMCIVEANPFLVASSCFVADRNSRTRVLQTFHTKTQKTLIIAASVKVFMFGNLDARADLNIASCPFVVFHEQPIESHKFNVVMQLLKPSALAL